jgi:hypothetical protein
MGCNDTSCLIPGATVLGKGMIKRTRPVSSEILSALILFSVPFAIEIIGRVPCLPFSHRSNLTRMLPFGRWLQAYTAIAANTMQRPSRKRREFTVLTTVHYAATGATTIPQ